jgi:TRAP-type mannitol/chloroaromatic compound transport system substrate-binding protein
MLASRPISLGGRVHKVLAVRARTYEEAAKNPLFKKILDNWRQWRAEQHRWFGIAGTRAELAVYGT